MSYLQNSSLRYLWNYVKMSNYTPRNIIICLSGCPKCRNPKFHMRPKPLHLHYCTLCLPGAIQYEKTIESFLMFAYADSSIEKLYIDPRHTNLFLWLYLGMGVGKLVLPRCSCNFKFHVLNGPRPKVYFWPTEAFKKEVVYQFEPSFVAIKILVANVL